MLGPGKAAIEEAQQLKEIVDHSAAASDHSHDRAPMPMSGPFLEGKSFGETEPAYREFIEAHYAEIDRHAKFRALYAEVDRHAKVCSRHLDIGGHAEVCSLYADLKSYLDEAGDRNPFDLHDERLAEILRTYQQALRDQAAGD